MGMTLDDFQASYWGYELFGEVMVRPLAMGSESIKVDDLVVN